MYKTAHSFEFPNYPPESKELQNLKQEALKACAIRGHMMGIWMDFDKNSASVTCILCQKSVCVDVTPLPNGIQISGEAVALECGK